MSATATIQSQNAVPETEWERIELLARMQVDALAGHEPESDRLERLANLEKDIQTQRALDGSWVDHIAADRLTSVEVNLVVIVVAPLARESIAWLYRQLEPDATGRGVSASMIQRLLPLYADEVFELQQAADANGRLAREGLLRIHGRGPDARLAPGPQLAERVDALPPEPDPPGLVRSNQTIGFDDLVLPNETLTRLRELVGLVQNRWIVEDEWGGEQTGGPIALFSGPSGVGKTYSAAAIGGELNWPVYSLEMARIASRWVGVAERRLDRLLDAAHARPMVLVLNEGETFFSKRGEIKEARDRFANLFVSFLLDRIERHRGPLILTSNLRDNIDHAFLRRFHCVVEFEKPDGRARTELWRRLLPPHAPRDVRLDFESIGETIALTGGAIRNAAHHAAHLAAAGGEPYQIGGPELALAVKREIEKRGRRVTSREMGCLAEFCQTEETP